MLRPMTMLSTTLPIRSVKGLVTFSVARVRICQSCFASANVDELYSGGAGGAGAGLGDEAGPLTRSPIVVGGAATRSEGEAVTHSLKISLGF